MLAPCGAARQHVTMSARVIIITWRYEIGRDAHLCAYTYSAALRVAAFLPMDQVGDNDEQESDSVLAGGTWCGSFSHINSILADRNSHLH